MTYSVLKVPLNPNQPTCSLQILFQRDIKMCGSKVFNCEKIYCSYDREVYKVECHFSWDAMHIVWNL